jgi:alanyl-tRNA synthetase
MSPQYPELVQDADRIQAVATAEEAAFLRTLRTGTAILDAAVADSKQAGRTTLSGAQAFTLHDTYGFPIDLTLEIATEQGLQVDEEGFQRLMREQQQRARPVSSTCRRTTLSPPTSRPPSPATTRW